MPKNQEKDGGTITFRLSKELREKLEQGALRHGKNLSEFITDLLENRLKALDKKEDLKYVQTQTQAREHRLQMEKRHGEITEDEYLKQSKENSEKYFQYLKENT